MVVVVVASIIGMFAAAAAMYPQQASAAAVDKCAYQQFESWDALVNCKQKDTPFILPFP
jgi:hypothetical protein